MKEYKKIVTQMKEQSSAILVNLSFLEMKISDTDSLEEIAIAIDELYKNYGDLLKTYKKSRKGGSEDDG